MALESRMAAAGDTGKGARAWVGSWRGRRCSRGGRNHRGGLVADLSAERASSSTCLRGGAPLHLRVVPWRPVDGRTQRRVPATAAPAIHRGPRRRRRTAGPVNRERVEVHVQVQRATKALDDRDRTSAAVAMTRCAGSLSVEALQGTRVDREHRAAEAVVPSKPIAKLEGKSQDPLSNRGPREHVVDEMRRALGQPAAAAARAEAAAFAGERNQPIGATVSTAKPGKPMREHAAAHESLELALHEQRARRTYERKIVSLVAAVQGSTARERHQDSCRCQPLRFQRVSDRSP